MAFFYPFLCSCNFEDQITNNRFTVKLDDEQNCWYFYFNALFNIFLHE